MQTLLRAKGESKTPLEGVFAHALLGESSYQRPWCASLSSECVAPYFTASNASQHRPLYMYALRLTENEVVDYHESIDEHQWYYNGVNRAQLSC